MSNDLSINVTDGIKIADAPVGEAANPFGEKTRIPIPLKRKHGGQDDSKK